jgi:ankyrin repeat protein
MHLLALNLQEQECLKALDVIDMNDCRAQLQAYTPGTCEWILSNNQFRQWISDNNSSLLHITGDMGTGKSILMSYLADHIKPHVNTITCAASHKITVCSFFCDDKDVGRKNGQAILRGLLYQILHQRHDLMEHATARFSEIAPGRWSLLVLWEILRDIMLNPITGTVVFILDAIDECEPVSRRRVLTLVRQFLTRTPHPSGNCIKFLISSRPNVDIMEEVGQCSNRVSLDDEGRIREVQRDLLLVVKDQLDELEVYTHWTTKTREALESSIVMKAEGNFLWVRLVIQRLKRGRQNKKFFDQVLDESPKDLDGMYCRILADIDTENQDDAAKILRILVSSLRPITTEELRLALVIGLHHRTLESVDEESDMAIDRTIRIILGSLVRIHAPKVHLVHQSAKEFLLRLSTGNVANLKAFEPDLRTLYGINLQAANLELATACIAFLALADFEDGKILDENASAFDELPGATEDSPWFLMRRASDSSSESTKGLHKTLMDQKPPFFEYSASHWTSHLYAAGSSLPQDVLKSAISISHWNTNFLSNWSDQYRLSSRDLVSLPKDLDPLIVAAFFGLIHLANEILHNYESELRENSKPLALSWACRMGYFDIVKALLDQGTPVSGVWVEGGSPLSWACAGGCLEIAQVLLNEADSSQVNKRDGNGRTPLSLAVGSGHIDITKLLLAREGVDVNMDDRTGSTPLLWAIGSKSEKQDLMLLTCLVSEPRVDITRRDRYGRTVLSWAAEMGALDAVNILLKSLRPDVESLLHDAGDTGKGWSPLSWAAFNGHTDVVKALCMTGRIDVQLASVDKRGQNVVSLAADRNQAEIIKILADFYPEGVDCPEESGRTPLSCAMWGSPSNAETVRTLLRTGLVDVNRRSANGRTPLSFAAAAGRADLVRILVEEGGADLDIPDNEGSVPGDVLIDWRSYQVKEEIERLRAVRSGSGHT